MNNGTLQLVNGVLVNKKKINSSGNLQEHSPRIYFPLKQVRFKTLNLSLDYSLQSAE